MTGLEAVEIVRAKTDTILLAFSCGKDSIAVWLECRRHFPNIVPFYLYLIPDLEFVQQSLDYYERFFGQRIIQLPHPSLYRMLRNYVFQPPQNWPIIAAADLPPFDFGQQEQLLRDEIGLSKYAYTAVGVRSADSLTRRIAIRNHGAVNHKGRKFYPVHDWVQADLVREFTKAGVKMPVDYRIFPRSLDGLDFQYLQPIREHFPRDYQRICELFPLVEAELWRDEYAKRA